MINCQIFVAPFPATMHHSHLEWCFRMGSYTSFTEFTSACYLLSVLRLSLFSDITWSTAKFSLHLSQQPCITATSNLVWCFSLGSYTSFTEFTSDSHLLPVLRLSLFSDTRCSPDKFSLHFAGVYLVNSYS